ncbi:polysaccharide pyruvyl transferase family protein [Gammaproteobacteria bacterium]|nr:polysaccharide pyruvyl transferase family protein [Gammaproteobacteria bacterium]
MIVLDPSSHQHGKPSENLGDLVIKQSIEELLSSRFKLQWLPYGTRNFNASPVVIGGANVIGPPRLGISCIWRPPVREILLKSLNVVTLGAGWWSYEAYPKSLQSRLMRRYLSLIHPHSVRDTYTADMLKRSGILNVYVTGCPSMIGHSEIKAKLESLMPVCTLTFYRRDVSRDALWMRHLLERFETSYFFIQGPLDLPYLNEVLRTAGCNLSRITLIHSFDELTKLLNSRTDLVHIGTRLHANMLFLKYGYPSLCLDVDSRTNEIKKSFENLPIHSLYDFIDSFNESIYHYMPANNFDKNFEKYLCHLDFSIRNNHQ